jgi:outer membrane protein assembly factor BamB
VANNTVYIGSWDSYLYALDAETGQENGDSKPVKTLSPTISRASVLTRGGGRSGLCRLPWAPYAIEASTGRKNGTIQRARAGKQYARCP